jgi:hypothetical protein
MDFVVDSIFSIATVRAAAIEGAVNVALKILCQAIQSMC